MELMSLLEEEEPTELTPLTCACSLLISSFTNSHMRTHQEDTICKARKDVSIGTNPAGITTAPGSKAIYFLVSEVEITSFGQLARMLQPSTSGTGFPALSLGGERWLGDKANSVSLKY